jgi:tetratricopeptide (TPR) repeat protein
METAQETGAERTADACRERFAAEPQTRDPEMARVFVAALTKLQRYAERDRFLNDLAGRYPTSQRVQCLRAERALCDGDVGGAAAIATKCVNGPTAAAARAICAEAHLRWAAAEPAEALHHYGQAFEHLKSLAELTPGDDAVIAKLALVEGERLGRAGAALQRTERALAKSATPAAELLEAHGRLLTAMGRPDEALAYLERAAGAQPSGRTWASLERGVFASQTALKFNRPRRDERPDATLSSN